MHVGKGQACSEKRKLAQSILERHQPPSGRGVSSLARSSFLLWPSAEKLTKHSGRYSCLLSFYCLSVNKIVLLISTFCQNCHSSSWERQTANVRISYSPTNFSYRLWDRRRLQITLCCLCSHPDLLWANRTGFFPLQCLQPIHLMLCALLASCRKCAVPVPQFPQV